MLALPSAGMAQTATVSAQADQRAEVAPRSEDIVVTGTRRSDRSKTDSSVPVDVITSKELGSVVSSDLQDKLAQTIPSYTVQTKPLYDAIMFIRPATLRGLTPDDTMVLVNGKRQHRSAYVNFNVLSGGSQAVDLSQIPTAALGRVEVLRDGASAQYGSDAIAGVINLILDNKPGYAAYAQMGQFYAGDGLDFQSALSAGWDLGGRGTFNTTFEYTNAKSTSRSLQREEAAALIAAGNVNVRQPAVTEWGRPDTELYRVAYNGEYALSDSATFYSFGLYGHSRGKGNVNWRSPNGSSFARSIFQDPPYNIYPTYDQKSRFPGGFTPFVIVIGKDLSLAAGVKGALSDDLSYDMSANWGRNRTIFSVINTLNPSYGPASPTEFDNGSAQTSELDLNLDMVYKLEAGLPTPVNIAFGVEYRREAFGLTAGEPASYSVGPLADLPAGAGGSSGIPGSAAGNWNRGSYGGYVDLDVDVSDAFNIGAAGRYEHYSDFGSTVNGKLSSRLKIAKGFSLRGAVSTGFRAPTPGQSFSSNLSTSPDPNRPGQIYLQRLIPATDPIAIGFGAKPLKPEKSVNLSFGAVVQPIRNLTVTADAYNINLRDRLTTSQLFGTPQERYNFFVNGYETRTRGLDLVTTYSVPMRDGARLAVTGAGNYTSTKIQSFQPGVINSSQILAVERALPHYSGTLTVDYSTEKFDLTVKGRYYGSLVDLFFDADAFSQKISPIFFTDVSASYNVTRAVKVTVGAENLFDIHPDKVVWGGPTNATNFLDFGRVYPSALPYSFEGGRYYARVAVKF